MAHSTPEPLLFESRDAANEWVASVYDATWRASLSPEQITALSAIKSGAFSAINGFLRTGRAGALPSARTIQRWVTAAVSALSVKPLPTAITVFRGISLRAMVGEVAPEDLAGGLVQDRAFISTTLWAPIAQRFGADLLMITVPAGTPAAWLDALEQRNELEILLQAGTKLQIDASATDADRRILLATVVG